jgi:hypothetical protein
MRRQESELSVRETEWLVVINSVCLTCSFCLYGLRKPPGNDTKIVNFTWKQYRGTRIE